jgi:hypothetical protein
MIFWIISDVPVSLKPHRARQFDSAPQPCARLSTPEQGPALFLDGARRLRIDVQPATGREIETLVREIYALPKAVNAVTKHVVTNDDAGR